jgi:protein ImuB
VFDDPVRERDEAATAPLERMNLSSQLADEMRTLGIHTLGAFLALPRSGLEVRYGREAAVFHDFASARTWTPLRPRALAEPHRSEIEIDPPDDQHTRLLFGIKTVLHGLLEPLSARNEGVGALLLTLHLEHAPAHAERIETAAPTLDVVRLVDLARLRLGNVALPAPVERIVVEIESVPAPAGQILLLAGPKRDPRAAAAALDRIRAAFGDDSVSHAELADSWLPEKSFRWSPIGDVLAPRPRDEREAARLVRNVLEKPVPLPDIPHHESERWLGRYGAVVSMYGPGRIRHGWWKNRVERDYYFVETRTHDVLWIYFDRASRGWYLQGIVD